VLKRELADFDGGDDICLTINMDIVNAIDQITDFIRLSKPEFYSPSSHAENSNGTFCIILELFL